MQLGRPARRGGAIHVHVDRGVEPGRRLKEPRREWIQKRRGGKSLNAGSNAPGTRPSVSGRGTERARQLTCFALLDTGWYLRGNSRRTIASRRCLLHSVLYCNVSWCTIQRDSRSYFCCPQLCRLRTAPKHWPQSPGSAIPTDDNARLLPWGTCEGKLADRLRGTTRRAFLVVGTSKFSTQTSSSPSIANRRCH